MSSRICSAAALILLALSSFVTFLSGYAIAEGNRVKCPVVVDRETGEYSRSAAKYRCYEDGRSARRAGYDTFQFSNDDSCDDDDDEGGSGLSLAGPGEKETTVFLPSAGGSVLYSFPGGGEFEIKVLSASGGRRLEEVLETSTASAGTATFSAQTVPVYIKVEGPGAWTAVVTVN